MVASPELGGAPSQRPRAAARAEAPGPPIKIAHLVLGLNVGGLERVVLRLIERLDRRRFTPLVCALEEPGALAPELERLGVPLTVLPRKPGIDLGLALRLARWLASEEVAIVHTHNPSPHLYGALGAAIAGIGLGRGRGPRVLHTKHGRNYPGSPRKVLQNRLASALSDRVVAVSDDARAVAVEIERAGADKVVTILNGVDTDEYRPTLDRARARQRLGVPPQGFHVGCVARLSPEKDHASLLDAFALLAGGRPDAHLTLVGDGACREALLARRDALGLGAKVTFAGTRADVAQLLGAFDVFSLSSLTEGISLTLIEAASTGLPIVATKVGGNAEIVVEGETGLLVPPADPVRFAAALASVAGLPEAARVAMGLAGRGRVIERFSLEGMARAYHRLYEAIVDRA